MKPKSGCAHLRTTEDHEQLFLIAAHLLLQSSGLQSAFPAAHDLPLFEQHGGPTNPTKKKGEKKTQQKKHGTKSFATILTLH
jgi:hypothetical protein